MRRYYNLTIQDQNPDTYGEKESPLSSGGRTFTADSRFLLSPALVRMGDLLHEGHKDPFTAAEMYMKAALRKDPQVCYTVVSACVFP